MELQRDAMIADLNKAMTSPDGDTCMTGLVIVDVRDFRELNRSFGVECGDAILQEISSRLGHLREDKAQCHYLGDDEFGVVLPNIKSPGIAMLSAETIAGVFKNVFEWGNHSLKITINSGIAYNLSLIHI